MPSYLSPGVYVEEVPAATRPIEGVGTAIAGFVGFAPSGPVNEPVLVTNWTQYVSKFGEIVEDFALAKSVYGYFNNGGGRAYIVRLPLPLDGSTPSPGLATAAIEAAGADKGSKGGPVFQMRVVDANAGTISVLVDTAAGSEPDFRQIRRDGGLRHRRIRDLLRRSFRCRPHKCRNGNQHKIETDHGRRT